MPRVRKKQKGSKKMFYIEVYSPRVTKKDFVAMALEAHDLRDLHKKLVIGDVGEQLPVWSSLAPIEPKYNDFIRRVKHGCHPVVKAIVQLNAKNAKGLSSNVIAMYHAGHCTGVSRELDGECRRRP